LKTQAAARNLEIAAAIGLPPAWNAVGPALLLVVVACLAYANAWPNTLIFDDKPYLDYERFTDLAAIPGYFLEHAWAARGVESALYRPLLLVSITFDANLFGDWYAGYHLVNILLHALATVLVYAFLARLLALDERTVVSRTYVALLAASIFAVHPVHAEVVNSVFNRSILLAALGVLGGLWWLLRYLNSRPVFAWAGLFIAYTYALFCRETAIVLPGMAAVLVWIYADGNPVARLRKTLPVFTLLIPMMVYLHMRSSALALGASDPDLVETSISAVAGRLDAGRLMQGEMILRTAGVWVQAYGVLLWPFNPKSHYSAPPILVQWAGLFLHLGLVGLAVFLLSRGRKGLLVGLVIFYLDLLPSSRLVGAGVELPQLSERFLYVASVGFLVMVAYLLNFLRERFDRVLAAAPVVLLLLTLAPVTWARNADWADEITLFESDYRKGVTGAYLMRLLTGAYLKKSEFAKAVDVCDANRELYGQTAYRMFTLHCASALSYSGRQEDAVQLYLAAASYESGRSIAYSNLAQHYLRNGRPDEARIQFEKAVSAEPDPALRAYQTGIMLMHLHSGDPRKWREARTYFQEALRLQPGMREAQGWADRLDRILEEPADAGE